MDLEKFAKLYLRDPQKALNELNGAPAERSNAKKLILVLEKRYEMKSDEMERRLRVGKIEDTHEICQWISALHTLRATEHLEAQ